MKILHLKFIVSIWGIEYLIFQIIATISVIIHVLQCLKFMQLSLSTSQDLSEDKNLIERGRSFKPPFNVLLAVA